MNETVVTSRPADGSAEAGVPTSPAPAAAPVTGPDEVEEVVIRPRRGWIAVDWRELYRYRELLYFLVWRDIKVRYKQTVLGAAWAVLQPVFYMVIFGFIFGGLAGMNESLPVGLQAHFGVWLFSGLLPWMLFQTALNDGGLSLVNQQHLLTKIYLPRLFVPAATIGRALVDMMLAWGVFAVLLAWYQPSISWTVVLLPVLIVLTAVTALGVAYVLAALSVTYRDFRFIIPFLVQAWMWLSFVAVPPQLLGGYDAAAAPAEGETVAAAQAGETDAGPSTRQTIVRFVFAANPMFGIVQSYRAAIFEDLAWDIPMLLVSTGSGVVLFTFGLFFFRRTERRFADIA